MEKVNAQQLWTFRTVKTKVITMKTERAKVASHCVAL